ncbi:MAG: hypothetical protein MR051_02035 [Lentisphaeria bacterium]|nr:hypothetical protein [Lentisphaeria bacterium]
MHSAPARILSNGETLPEIIRNRQPVKKMGLLGIAHLILFTNSVANKRFFKSDDQLFRGHKIAYERGRRRRDNERKQHGQKVIDEQCFYFWQAACDFHTKRTLLLRKRVFCFSRIARRPLRRLLKQTEGRMGKTLTPCATPLIRILEIPFAV